MQFPRNSFGNHKIQWNAVIKPFIYLINYSFESLTLFYRFISILEWFLPDIIMVISTPSIYLILRRSTVAVPHDIESSGTTARTESNQISTEYSNILVKLGEFILLFLLHESEILTCNAVYQN